MNKNKDLIEPYCSNRKMNKTKFKLLDNSNEIKSLDNKNISFSEKAKIIISKKGIKKSLKNSKLEHLNINNNKSINIINKKENSNNNDNNSSLNEKRKISSSNKVKKGIKVLSMTEKGTKNINQDNYLLKENIFNIKDFSIFSVFDGHGIDGYYISKIAKDEFLNYFTNNTNLYYIPRTNKSIISLNNNENEKLNKYISTEEIYDRLSYNNYNIIRNIYIKIDEKLKKKDYDSDLSGSTSCTIFIIGKHIICSNLGDSRAILIKKSNEIINLSNDHKPNNKKEYDRIKKKGGEIRKNNIYYYNNNEFKYNNIIDNNYDKIPYRIYLKYKNFPGLAMSRSIGDFIAKKIGVINIPEIFNYTICDDDKFIILASDGLWEFVSSEDARNIVNSYYLQFNLNEAIYELISLAKKKFNLFGKYVDDITIILIFLNVEND